MQSIKLFWVRKLIGKFGVLYNRRLRVRGSPYPLQVYETGLPLCATESKAFRTQSDVERPERSTAAEITLFSSGDTLACNKIPRNLAFGTFGLPIFVFIILSV
jgi:hypothetical protein